MMRRKCRQMCDVSFDRLQVSLFGHPVFICLVVCNILFCFGCEDVRKTVFYMSH